MSGIARKQKRTEARREYERFTRMWREDMRLAGIYGKRSPYKRPTFSQWYAQHQHELGQPQPQVPVYDPNTMKDYLGKDPWAENLDPMVLEEDPPSERGVMTIDIVGNGDEEV